MAKKILNPTRLNLTWIELSIGKLQNLSNRTTTISKKNHYIHLKLLYGGEYGLKLVHTFLKMLQSLKMNDQRYRHIIETFLKPYLNDFDVESVYYQQDGATSYTSDKTNIFMQDNFLSCLTLRLCDVDWPPGSPDYFLWWYLRDIVYGNHPTRITQLKQNICTQVAMISNDLCGNVRQHLTKRRSYKIANLCNVYVYIKV